MEVSVRLPGTLRRLETLIAERGLKRSAVLDPADLAARTALPERTVLTLLRGGAAPEDTVNDRVRLRIHTLAQGYLARSGKRMSDLAADISQCLGVSDYWARQVCDGRKMPSVELLHGLVRFFDVEDGEAFFTASADEALNRALLPALHRLERAEQDPVQALLDRYGVSGADLRSHGSITRDQLERVLEGVLRSVLPAEGETHR
ncbi:hypothetical protein [Streptomyces lincolnensis]|uniref:hypothetical protein n=1 Tax=Streptomyces lincolnensis TaxID=1915 RepID=UPI0037D5D302